MNINLRFRSSLPLNLLLSYLFDFLFHYTFSVFLLMIISHRLMICSNKVRIWLNCNTSTAYTVQYVFNTVKFIVMCALSVHDSTKVAVTDKSTSHYCCILRMNIRGAHIMTVTYSNATSTRASISFAFRTFLLLSTHYSRVWRCITIICTLIMVVWLVHLSKSIKIVSNFKSYKEC